MTKTETLLLAIIRNYDRVWNDLCAKMYRNEDGMVVIEDTVISRLHGRISAERAWTQNVLDLIETPETAEESEDSDVSKISE